MAEAELIAEGWADNRRLAYGGGGTDGRSRADGRGRTGDLGRIPESEG